MRIELDRADFEMLMLALGFAAGAAHKADDMKLFWEFIKLANAINKDNPNFRPYAIPPGFQISS